MKRTGVLVEQLAFQTDGRLYGNMNLFEIFSAPTDIPVDEWTHVAWTYDEVNHRLYKMGAQVAIQPFNAPLGW